MTKLKVNYVWSRVFGCSVKTYATRFSTELYFITILLMKGCEILKSYALPVLC